MSLRMFSGILCLVALFSNVVLAESFSEQVCRFTVESYKGAKRGYPSHLGTGFFGQVFLGSDGKYYKQFVNDNNTVRPYGDDFGQYAQFAKGSGGSASLFHANAQTWLLEVVSRSSVMNINGANIITFKLFGRFCDEHLLDTKEKVDVFLDSFFQAAHLENLDNF